MQTESEMGSSKTLAQPSLAPETRGIGNTIRLTGWITFWLQLAIGVVSVLALLFALTGRGLVQQQNTGLGIGIFWAVCGIVVLLFSLYWDFRYTRIGKALENRNSALHPSKPDTTRILRLGIIISLVGILLTLLGAGSTVLVLVAKSISQPPGVAITDPYRIIRPMDVFVAVADITGIAAHYVGTVASLWLLERVHQH
ncbi:MAG: DUF3611 family protein [Nostoc sp. SerVER01]|nr:DUF3611 family protein [Nostoc sp. SerVER01]MDZ8027317.1 DUF3611 family protein [Nostoc sp. DedQUE11]MDZ8077663.1 DUF3611 family protein [Nostoc sp. DcaGUA01]